MRQSPPLTSADASGPSLADLEQALQTTGQLSAVRRRDLRSAVARVAALLGERRRPVERGQSGGGRPLSQEARQHPLGFFSRCAAEWPSPGDASRKIGAVSPLANDDGAAARQAPPAWL